MPRKNVSIQALLSKAIGYCVGAQGDCQGSQKVFGLSGIGGRMELSARGFKEEYVHRHDDHNTKKHYSDLHYSQ